MSLLQIANGRVIDPTHGVDEEPRDVWIRDGVVVDRPSDPEVRADRVIDARGCVVMPGGVDIHSHIAGSKVNASRIYRPEERRAEDGNARTVTDMFRGGTSGSCPSTELTALQYVGLGYTTANDAAIAPSGARLAHLELADLPLIDKSFLVLMGNHRHVLETIARGESSHLEMFVNWVLRSTRAIGVKVVNPAGVENWKQGYGNLSDLDQSDVDVGVTPRQTLVALAQTVDELGVPHPIHVHGLNLGLPGNAATTLDTFRALGGHRAHFAHVQFHSYEGDPHEPGKMTSGVERLAEWVNAHPEVTLDVGQVLFGSTTSMTGDSPTGEFLARLSGRKWISHDVEMETGCGVLPIVYSDKNRVHALQWSIGLEWFLRVNDPWQVALSTDHPNGASFQAYPELMALLMDRGLRRDTLDRLPESVRETTPLRDLDREYTLTEIATITRAAPARMLGLTHKGHLGPGADGDVTVYQPDDDLRRMFAMPRYVIKAGEVVLDDTQPRVRVGGKTHHVDLTEPPDSELAAIRDWFDTCATTGFANFPIPDEMLPDARAVGPAVKRSLR
jgi:formylmethanofuran dehydrogenase subunit A